MHNRTKPAGPMWRMTIQLRSAPHCPGCCEELQGVVVEISNGWAWCPICVATKVHRSKAVRYALATAEFRKEATRQHGLFFYTPGYSKRGLRTAMEYALDLKCDLPMSTARASNSVIELVLPGGIVDPERLELTALTEAELDRKHIQKHGAIRPRVKLQSCHERVAATQHER